MTSDEQLPFFSERRILDLAAPCDLVEALRVAFLKGGQVPPRPHYALGENDTDGILLLMPAWQNNGPLGVKVMTYFGTNPDKGLSSFNGYYLLFDGQTGQPAAIFHAAALTRVRTAAVSALASMVLSKPDARRLLLIGTGALAPYMARAHAAVRQFDRIEVWGRSREKAQAIARELGCEIAENLDRAIRAADVITAATSSAEPLVRAGIVAPGTHVDLVGSFTRTMREADESLMQNSRVFLDSWTGLEESGDLAGLSRERIVSLEQLLKDPSQGRRSAEDITVFKAVGTGLSDLAVAELLCAKGRLG
jgi:ornithine cyclodeaminase